MSSLGQALTFAANLYRQRAQIAYAGYLRREPFALLQLRPGRADPYPLKWRSGVVIRGPLRFPVAAGAPRTVADPKTAVRQD